MKKSFALLLSVIIVIMLCACGALSNGTSQAISNAQSDASNEEAGETTNSEETEKEMSAAFDGDLTDYSIGNYIIKIPSVWQIDDSSVKVGNDGLIKGLSMIIDNLSDEELKYVSENPHSIRESYLPQFLAAFDNPSVSNETTISINGINMVREEITYNDVEMTYYWFVDADSASIVGISFAQQTNSQYDYTNDFESIISTIKYADYFEAKVPISYTDLVNGNYENENVYLIAIVDDVLVKNDDVRFRLWYEVDDTYKIQSQNSLGSRQFNENPRLEKALAFQDGDIVRIALDFNAKGKLAASTWKDIEIIDHCDVNEIIENVFEKTDTLEYEAVMRNPENFKNVPTIITGEIFQVVDDHTYLVKTKDGIVWAPVYYNNKTMNYLEGDNVRIYGQLEERTRTYSSLVKDNTVPWVSGYIIQLQ